MVAIPILLSTRAAIDEQIGRLEVHHLSNPAGEIYFALLSDWTDALTESTAEDAGLLAAVTRRHHAAQRALSERLAAPIASSCSIAAAAGTRRNGGGSAGSASAASCTSSIICCAARARRRFSKPATRSLPTDVRYVVTLDSDTRLPRDAISRLVGKMAHPLNRPRLDPLEHRVTEGYGVLQPRVTPSLPVGAEGSLFQRIFSSNNGIDPYSSAVSDVYQDLFGEGSYSGKGIYDIDAFEAALQGRVPDSTMLSHDLFEGVFARSGLASDIEVVEEFPARYDVAAARQHRWARGDWQLLPWMLGLVKGTGRHESAGFVPAIGFWKMFDNLRRTLSTPAAIAGAAGGLDPAAAGRARLDGLRPARSSPCRRSCRSRAPCCRGTPASPCAATSARSARTSCRRCARPRFSSRFSPIMPG